MEIRVLRYFLEVAREGSVTHAAQRLHISQPTLSKQLKDLEGELGKKLFVRSSFSVRLTEEGMLLRKRAEDILDMVDKTEEEFKALGELTGGDIRVGCAESDDIKHLARCVKAMQEQYPRIRLHLYSGNTEDLSERLDRGLLDFAVIAQTVDLSKYNYLEMPSSDTWGVVMRKDSPLAQKEAVQIEDLLHLPLICSRQGITEDFPKWFGERVDSLNIVATFNLAYNAGILAREGLGYVLTFGKLINVGVDSELCFRPLTPALETKMYVVWKKYQVFTRAAEVFLAQLQRSLLLATNSI
ncbi:LysR family transcriptional regulator [Butyricicoccus faecihominis]|uniref:LysR family transcriptional regulator n=1 Tax=Butyricicoccus faecihominis TaxID=1712515 RepID=UPI0024784305|nr:LysR family transcriptional regulator [Butyricicoccus faecihominis]MCQ5128389.1 LysR family transcriptional regulator [Butyricicoccus faecihominis]